MNDFYVAWQEEEHAFAHEYRKYFPTFILAKIFENFNEVNLISEIKKDRNEGFSIIDVGCATGEFFRYFSYRYPKVNYTGYDVSKGAIKNAKQKFPKVNFLVGDENLSCIKDGRFEMVFSRDVIVHHTKPFHFLRRLYDISNKYIILRLRTRDRGRSILDPEISCQLHYNNAWVPFLVINCDEIISEVRNFRPPPTRIKFLKEYVILGGENFRYLPKELYYKETKTAEASLLIEKGNGISDCKIEEHERKNSRKFFLLGRAFAEPIKFLVGKNYKGRVWW